MAILFSAVGVRVGEEQTSLLVSGVPKGYEDLSGWRAFEHFLMDVDQESDIQVDVKSYLSGDGEVFRASVEEVAYMMKRMEMRSDFLDTVLPLVSGSANHGEVWIVLAVLLLLWRKTRRTGLSVGAGLLLDYAVCNLTLKPLIGRIRPFIVNTAVELLVACPTDASFPPYKK